MDANPFISAEVRAEMARQRKSIEGAVPVLGKSKNAIARKWRGEVGFTLDELWALAGWLGVPIGQFLPKGYMIVVGPDQIPVDIAS